MSSPCRRFLEGIFVGAPSCRSTRTLLSVRELRASSQEGKTPGICHAREILIALYDRNRRREAKPKAMIIRKQLIGETSIHFELVEPQRFDTIFP
ncbi:hypothetical protein TNCT_385751 [Trichonephila clavata]|uniref:Uncharacterized protein n=1 Tax=Trichonephila clavata TaxID=2740835 RepID=A0A8X6LM25_TRICU|nr:hypothetical protein TNCT_385751 [Trichonephila clavata]